MASEKPSLNRNTFFQKSMDSTLHRMKSVLVPKKPKSPDLNSSLTSLMYSHGLTNPEGENNCFLNSAVQALWHLDVFRKNFKEMDGHSCLGAACIFCALKVLFTQFVYSDKPSLPPDALRRALAISFVEQKRFQLRRMDDAAECFENILQQIHVCLVHDVAQDQCTAFHCIPHQKFAMTIIEQSECECGATSEPFLYSQYVHYISSTALCFQARTLRRDRWLQVGSFGQILQTATAEMKDCPSKCGKEAEVRKDLISDPDVVTVGVIWNKEPTLSHITDVMKSLGTDLKLKEMFFRVTDNRAADCTLNLVGFIAYYGKHYSTFFYHSGLKQWLYLEDTTVKPIGDTWQPVVDYCIKSHYQPLLLFYANPHWTLVKTDSAPKVSTLLPGYEMTCNSPEILPSPEKPQANQSSADADYWPEKKIPELTGTTSPCDFAAKTNPGGVIEIGQAALGLLNSTEESSKNNESDAKNANLLEDVDWELTKEGDIGSCSRRLNIKPLEEFKPSSLSSNSYSTHGNGSCVQNGFDDPFLIQFDSLRVGDGQISKERNVNTETEFSEYGVKTRTYNRYNDLSSMESNRQNSSKLEIKPIEPFDPSRTDSSSSYLQHSLSNPSHNGQRSSISNSTHIQNGNQFHHSNSLNLGDNVPDVFSYNPANYDDVDAPSENSSSDFIITYNVLSDYDGDNFNQKILPKTNGAQDLQRSSSEIQSRGPSREISTRYNVPSVPSDPTPAERKVTYTPFAKSNAPPSFERSHVPDSSLYTNDIATRNAKNLERSTSAVSYYPTSTRTNSNLYSNHVRSDSGLLTAREREAIGNLHWKNSQERELTTTESTKSAFDLLPHEPIKRGGSPFDYEDGNLSLKRKTNEGVSSRTGSGGCVSEGANDLRVSQRTIMSGERKTFENDLRMDAISDVPEVNHSEYHVNGYTVNGWPDARVYRPSVSSDRTKSEKVSDHQSYSRTVSLETVPRVQDQLDLTDVKSSGSRNQESTETDPIKSKRDPEDERDLKLCLTEIKELVSKSKDAERSGDLAAAAASCLQAVAVLKFLLAKNNAKPEVKSKLQTFYSSMRNRSRSLNKMMKQQSSSIDELRRQQINSSLEPSSDDSRSISHDSRSSSADPLQSVVNDMKQSIVGSDKNHQDHHATHSETRTAKTEPKNPINNRNGEVMRTLDDKDGITDQRSIASETLTGRSLNPVSEVKVREVNPAYSYSTKSRVNGGPSRSRHFAIVAVSKNPNS